MPTKLNEDEIGVAFVECLGKIVDRKDLWVTSKLWNSFHDPPNVRPALIRTLKDLQLDYLDAYLMHWPYSFQYEGITHDKYFPYNEDRTIRYGVGVDYIDTWKEMEKLVDEGLVKHIGFSNFNSVQIQRVIDNSRIKPTILQIEVHPYLTQEKLIKFAHEKGIGVTAYSPLGSPDRPWADQTDPSVLSDPVLIKIAEKYKKSPAQILIRFPIDRGIVVIPKSRTPSRISENRDVFDFKLSQEDINSLLALNRDFRACPCVRDKLHKYWPFSIEF